MTFLEIEVLIFGLLAIAIKIYQLAKEGKI